MDGRASIKSSPPAGDKGVRTVKIKHEMLPRGLINQIAKMYGEGVAPITIAERLREKRNRIYYALRRNGVVLQGSSTYSTSSSTSASPGQRRDYSEVPNRLQLPCYR